MSSDESAASVSSSSSSSPSSEDDTDDESYDDEEPLQKRASPQKKASPRKKTKKSSLSCSNCGQMFISKAGLTYHEKKKVCHKKEEEKSYDEEPPQKRASQQKKTSTRKKTKKSSLSCSDDTDDESYDEEPWQKKAPPQKRRASPRKKASAEEDTEDESYDEEPWQKKASPQKRRASPRKRASKEDDTDDESYAEEPPQKKASPQKRRASPRKRAPKEDDNDDESYVKEPSQKKASPQKRRASTQKSAPKEVDTDGESSDEEPPQKKGSPKKRRASPRKKASPQKKTKNSSLSCSNCGKTFSSNFGLTYHEKNKVCHNEEEEKPQAEAEESSKGEKSLECPDCKKVFKTFAGFDYHVKKKVCIRQAEEVERQKAETRRLVAEAEGKQPSSRRRPESERTCDACKRVFSTRNGLDYHVKNDVCKGGTLLPSSKKKKKAVKKARTCPDCGKTFSVLLGLQYHVQNKVCQKVKAPTPKYEFPVLTEGLEFITAFGIVQVVTDKRDVPQETEIPNKAGLKRRNNVVSKLHERQKRHFMSASIQNRLKRKRLGELYTKGKHQDPQEVFNVYYGHDPRTQEPRKKPQTTVKPDVPIYPQEASPDRMVECILVPDKRRVVRELENDDDDDTDQGESVNSDAVAPKMRLYLKRCDLTKPYSSDMVVYPCADCGAPCHSRYGAIYHAKSKVCIKRSKDLGEQIQDRLETVEETVNAKLIQDEKRKEKKRKREENKDTFMIGAQKFVDPNIVLAELEAELAQAEAILAQPIPERPKKKKKKRRRRRKKVVPSVAPPPAALLPAAAAAPPRPTIDATVLIDEADAGRYPSIRRYDGEHMDVCAVCREPGTLICCDFCSNAVHMPCMWTKLAVKAPDDEDFMCFKCIQYILARRTRAEKRRKEMLSNDDAEEEDQDNPYVVMAKQGREVSELKELLKDAQGRLSQAVETSKIYNMRYDEVDLR